MTGEEDYSRWTEIAVRNSDEAIARTAREILEVVNPDALAVYADDTTMISILLCD